MVEHRSGIGGVSAMSESNFQDDFSSVLKDLAKALSERNVEANRMWLFCVAITVLVIGNLGSTVGITQIEFLGIKLDRDTFFPSSALVLLAANIAYCSSHIQGYRIGIAFGDLVKRKYGNEGNYKLSESTPMKTAAYLLLAPNYNRIHPIFHRFTPDGKAIWYRLLKLFVDVVYSSIPWMGIFAALCMSWYGPYFWVPMLLLPLSAISTMVLFLNALDWTLFTTSRRDQKSP
jgi:hypothetical protein